MNTKAAIPSVRSNLFRVLGPRREQLAVTKELCPLLKVHPIDTTSFQKVFQHIQKSNPRLWEQSFRQGIIHALSINCLFQNSNTLAHGIDAAGAMKACKYLEEIRAQNLPVLFVNFVAVMTAPFPSVELRRQTMLACISVMELNEEGDFNTEALSCCLKRTFNLLLSGGTEESYQAIYGFVKRACEKQVINPGLQETFSYLLQQLLEEGVKDMQVQEISKDLSWFNLSSFVCRNAKVIYDLVKMMKRQFNEDSAPFAIKSIAKLVGSTRISETDYLMQIVHEVIKGTKGIEDSIKGPDIVSLCFFFCNESPTNSNHAWVLFHYYRNRFNPNLMVQEHKDRKVITMLLALLRKDFFESRPTEFHCYDEKFAISVIDRLCTYSFIKRNFKNSSTITVSSCSLLFEAMTSWGSQFYGPLKLILEMPATKDSVLYKNESMFNFLIAFCRSLSKYRLLKILPRMVGFAVAFGAGNSQLSLLFREFTKVGAYKNLFEVLNANSHALTKPEIAGYLEEYSRLPEFVDSGIRMYDRYKTFEMKGLNPKSLIFALVEEEPVLKVYFEAIRKLLGGEKYFIEKLVKKPFHYRLRALLIDFISSNNNKE